MEYILVTSMDIAAYGAMAALAIAVVVLLPLALFRRTRAVAAIGLLLCSFAFGFALFMYGPIVTYGWWGWVGLVIGLAVLGIGVAPVGFVAAVLHGAIVPALTLCVLAALTYASRVMGMWLATLSSDRAGRLPA